MKIIKDVSKAINTVLRSWGEDPQKINCGNCCEFANAVCCKMGWDKRVNAYWGDELPHLFTDKHEPDAHCFITFNGKYYDSECPEGVETPALLPFYQRQLNRLDLPINKC